MAIIDSSTLTVAIQAVSTQIRVLRALMATETGEDAADTGELLIAYDLAAQDLRRAYDVEARTIINLPPYDELAPD